MDKPNICKIKNADGQTLWRVSCGSTDALYEELEIAAKKFEDLCNQYRLEKQ
jgi:hypothetical protein